MQSTVPKRERLMGAGLFVGTVLLALLCWHFYRAPFVFWRHQPSHHACWYSPCLYPPRASGKTSLLRHVLQHSGLKIGCIVNDVAAVNIDAKLIRADQNRADPSSTTDLADTIELANGCACMWSGGVERVGLLRLQSGRCIQSARECLSCNSCISACVTSPLLQAAPLRTSSCFPLPT